MADESRFTSFQTRFEAALQTYQQTTGVTLAEHPLTVQLQNPHSIACSAENITVILKWEARASSDHLQTARVMMSIESTVSLLFTLSSTASFCNATGLVRIRKALLVCFTSLTDFFSRTHPRRRYLPVSPSSLGCVPFSRHHKCPSDVRMN